MANNKISGIYNLRSGNFAEYTFTGNNRFVPVSITPQELKLISISNGHEIGENAFISFLKNNTIHLKNIRVLTPGGDGLRTTTNEACLFNLLYIDADNTNKLATIITVLKFNEWQPIDIYLRPYQIKSIGESFKFAVSGLVNIDDYNIQTAYVNKVVKFYVELQIETAGVIRDGKII